MIMVFRGTCGNFYGISACHLAILMIFHVYLFSFMICVFMAFFQPFFHFSTCLGHLHHLFVLGHFSETLLLLFAMDFTCFYLYLPFIWFSVDST